jgi:hypothetical protein
MRRMLLILLVGCASASVPKPVERPAPPRAELPARPVSLPLRIEVTSDDKIENCLHVKLHFTGRLAASPALAFRPLHSVTLSEASARDEKGAVAVTQEENGLKLAERGREELHVQYALKFPESGAAGAPFSESIELQVAGEDLLALPADPSLESQRWDVALEIKTGNTVTGGASSFGLGHARTVSARLAELRGAFFLGGEVGTAEFHAGDGDDVTAWVGHTAFDPRWIGAEVAATRAAVDLYVGRQHAGNGPPLAFLIVPTKRDDLPVVMMPRSRGFLVSVDRRAVWNAQARILVGQALSQRYLGGFVSLGPRESEAAGLWSDGFARAVGREVVFDMGMIEASDRAAEVNQLLFAETFSTDPKRTTSVRGALMATALGAGLRSFVRERLQDAGRGKTDQIAPEAFRAKVGNALFDAKEIPLPVDMLGKCWRLERKTLIPFELGFVASAGEEMKVTSVVPKSRAEAAGVRLDDVIEKIDYRAGAADSPVKLTIRRGDKSISLTFLPAGVGKPGRVFTRVNGIPDDRC